MSYKKFKKRENIFRVIMPKKLPNSTFYIKAQ